MEKGNNKTIGEVSRETGLSKSHVSRVLNGKKKPSIEALVLIARAKGMRVNALVEELKRKWREEGKGVGKKKKKEEEEEKGK